MPMLVRRMWVEEMNAEFSQSAEDDETPVIGSVGTDLSDLGIVATEI